MTFSDSSVSGYEPKPQKPSTVLLRISAVFSLLYGLFFFSAFIEDLVTGNYEGGKAHQMRKETPAADSSRTDNSAEDTSFGVVLGLFLTCGVLPIGLSVFNFYVIQRRVKFYRLQTDAWFENALLRFASRNNGRLLIPQVTEEFQIGVSESKKILDQLVVKNVAEILVSETGELVYLLRGFGDDQSGAERIL